MEALDHDKTAFVTLTYDDAWLPIQPRRPVHYPSLSSLSIQDLQRYFKRLRKRVDDRIRYYACGEYGEREFRPHYHAIIFGVGTFDGPVTPARSGYYAEAGHPLRDAWPMGHVNVGIAQADSMAYVAQYIDKKRYGETMAFEHYNFRQPEFQLQSLGIGANFLDEDIIRYAQEDLKVKGYFTNLPRYLQKRLQSSKELRALDYMVYNNRRKTAVIVKQVELCDKVTDIGGIPFRDMDPYEKGEYIDGLRKRNKIIRTNLVNKGKLKEKKL